MDHSPLKILAAELRMLIYEELFDPSVVIVVSPEERYGMIVWRGWSDDHAALLHTCRALWEETLPVFYKRTSFHLELPLTGDLSAYVKSSQNLHPVEHMAQISEIHAASNTLLHIKRVGFSALAGSTETMLRNTARKISEWVA